MVAYWVARECYPPPDGVAAAMKDTIKQLFAKLRRINCGTRCARTSDQGLVYMSMIAAMHGC